MTTKTNHQPDKVNVGVIGCGNISAIYFKVMKTFDILNVVGCADLDFNRAQAKAAEYGIKAYTVAELLADPAIDIVVNLTIPKAHAEVGKDVIEAGKSVYNEKPLAALRQEGRQLLDAAEKQQVLIGGAPDTFLGAGLQTCRKLIDDGLIGEPVAATAFMISHGHESWHPDPAFYYQSGGGPMFDMGPYYLTGLVSLLGPVKRVTGSTRISLPERVISSQPKQGTKIKVEVPTHVIGVLDFVSGPLATVITTFDAWDTQGSHLQINGTLGTLDLGDPNGFGGPVQLLRAGEKTWSDVPLSHGFSANSRGIGVADMAYALRTGSPQRANGLLAFHVLDIMHAIHDASDRGQHITLESRCERPAAFPVGKTEQELWPVT